MFDLVALMPMRHFSSRVKGKNYRAFGDGRPLFFQMAEKLLSCKEIDKVVINTDSSTIKELCEKNFPEIIIIERPEYLSGEYCPMNDVLLHDINKIESKFYLQTHSTNPLLSTNSLSDAINFLKKTFQFMTLFSVTKNKLDTGTQWQDQLITIKTY